MAQNPSVLISWVALNNDPYEREPGSLTYRLVDGRRRIGPTLNLLLAEAPAFVKRIDHVVLFHGSFERSRQVALQTRQAVLQARPRVKVHLNEWKGDDPTDHKAIFDFLRERMPVLRKQYDGQELIIHVSPGTPSMHTVWVLMAETGFIDPPFQIVQSYRVGEGKGTIVPVQLGIDTFFKRYAASKPAASLGEEETVFWDIRRFSPRLQDLYREARRYAHLNVPILLLGERGTGKTTMASWIRLHSPHRKKTQDRNWPAVACGQYSPGTMRAELFGYVKGAFTDAKQDHEGLLAAADGDTLFLDEIADVSRDLQRLLIKALEEKSYLPLGASQPRTSDFRLLSATNLPWRTLQERLDPDFMDRISTFRLHLPPLRDLPDDIPWLWEAAYKESTGRARVDVAKTVLADEDHQRVIGLLRQHPLPGNIRDLLRLAYCVLAARSDPLEPLSSADAVEYALREFGRAHEIEEATEDLARQVARCYSCAEPLDGILKRHETLDTSTVEEGIKGYMAKELRRLARERGIAVEQLCDVTERTVRGWAHGSAHPVRKGRKSKASDEAP
ncbi:MAG: sigma 54-interacting transcriptional regulator [Phycisphaerae bacterium]|nr:sigma 54-interacting transcriptional regulator [Phycisphaerae bacterium]